MLGRIRRLWQLSAPPDDVPAVEPEGELSAEPADDTQAARAILALAIERYQYEHGRTKDIEAKAGPTLGLNGAILVLAAGTLKDGAPCLIGWEQGVYNALVFGGIAVLLLAAWFLLRTLWPTVFDYFDLADWVTYEETRRGSAEVRALLEELAGSYRRYTEANYSVNKRKARAYIRALVFLSIGVTLIVAGLLWASCGIPRIGTPHLW
jgi:hypothetical protein